MNSEQKGVLHFIQDFPTPHNNALLQALENNSAIRLRIWYAQPAHPQYSFSADLAQEVKESIIYGSIWPSWRLIKTAIFNRKDKLFIVGWMNPTTRLLVPLLCMLRRPYNIWFDLPQDRPATLSRKWIRNLYYLLLKLSRSTTFAVGEDTVRFFAHRGFPEDRLINFPIYSQVGESVEEYQKKRADIRAGFAVADSDLFIVAGSRLTHEKGFDLLIRAIAGLQEDTKIRIKLLIVGRGPEHQALVRLALDSKLEGSVFFKEWMNFDAFMMHLGAADLAAHPARFDAYGGITISAMAAGVPVMGSYQAGSAKDRIRQGKNGWLYQHGDIAEMTRLLTVAVRNRDELKKMGVDARRTAESYSPRIGALKLIDELV